MLLSHPGRGNPQFELKSAGLSTVHFKALWIICKDSSLHSYIKRTQIWDFSMIGD